MEINTQIVNKNGSVNSLQITSLGVINVGVTEFISPIDSGVLVKNDGADIVQLDVLLVGNSNYEMTNFFPGWNVEIVKRIRVNVTVGLNIKYGY